MRCLALGLALAMALAPPALSAAQPLGRLFYTPVQRDQLDVARSRKSRPTVAAEHEPSPLPELVTYDGVVRRSDGRSTVWINNRPVNDGRTPADVPVSGRLRADGSVRLGIPRSDRSVNLKVGQSVDIVSGRIAEPYSRARGEDQPAQEPPGIAAPPRADKAPSNERAARATRQDADADGWQLR